MDKIGSWWLASQEAQVGEEVLWSCLASRTVSDDYSVSGRIYVTNKRLLFNPSLLHYIAGGKKWGAALDEVRAVDKQPKEWRRYPVYLLTGGGPTPRDKIKVLLQDGSSELFAVIKIDQVIARLQSTMAKR